MKKIFRLLLIFCFLFLSLNYANAENDTQKIQFIYINGSNSNTESAKAAYVKGFNALHKQMKSVIENDEFVRENLLNKRDFSINENKDILFWGFSSQQELDIIKNDLEEAKKSSPIVAQQIRSILAHCMHDAIWVQKEVNMQKTVNQLQKFVLAAHSKGEKVILLGHSAGSFVSIGYLRHKLKIVNVDLFSGKNENKYTCVDAFVQSGMGYMLATEQLIKTPNEKQFQDAYTSLDKYTELTCSPDDTVIGIVNFGSPFSLFYSTQITRSKDLSSDYRLQLLKYLQAHDIFLLTVNFSDDPIGLPVNRNITKADIEMGYNTTLSENGRGFIYNYSKQRSIGIIPAAHFAYWKNPKRFAKMVRDAYKKGYNNFYSIY